MTDGSETGLTSRFRAGLNASISVTREVDAQPVKAPARFRLPLDLVNVEHASDPSAPIRCTSVSQPS